MIELLSDLIRLLLLVVATEAVTEILVSAKLTDSLRAAIFTRAFPRSDGQPPKPGPWLWRFINDVFGCGYCMSVWISFATALLSPQWLSSSIPIIGLVVNWLVMVFVIHRTSNWLHEQAMIIKKGRVKTYDIELKHKVDSYGSDGQTGGTPGSEAGSTAGSETSRNPHS